MARFVAFFLAAFFMVIITASGADASGTPVQLAASSDPTAERESVAQKARADLQNWQKKLSDFGNWTESQGKKDSAAAIRDLNEAWVNADREAHKLQDAGAADWASAKVAYDKAAGELADRWHRLVGPDK
jgi:hypothetical protein